jgi:GNAT superfamily N-acetyltransferase
MNVILRLGELEKENAALLSLLQKHLSVSIDRQRLDWLYRYCPHGEATVWVAAEADSGRLVGAAAVFPRRINLGETVENGFVLGDFCVSADYRSLGLAIRLQRKCLEIVQNGRFAAGYDLPGKSMVAVYRRLGSKPNDEMVRMVKLLRADGKIGVKVKFRTVASLLSGIANLVLRVQHGSPRRQSGVSFEVQEGRCGQEYTDLARSVQGRLGVCVDRTAEYLNWRYLDHPHEKYEILAARRKGQLEGYVAFRQEGSRASVVDWFGQEPAELRKDLIREMIALVKPRGCESVQACVLASHSFLSDLRSLGFRPRESSPVVFLGPSGKEPGSSEKRSWLLMDGDREA